MNWKSFIPLVLAIVLGLVAAKVARDVLNRQHQVIPQGNLAQIVVTKRSVAPGQELSPDDLTIGQVSSQSVPEQSFSTIADLLNRTAKIEMVKGQAVVEPLLAERGAGSGLQALVPSGMRAITIEVNEFSSVAGMLSPGSRVDVVATLQASGNEEMSARTIVQNVKVTAVGQRVTPDPKDEHWWQKEQQVFRSVTLLCSPEEAEALELANTTGRPWLILRSNKGDEMIESPGVTLPSLRGRNGAIISRKSDPFVPVIDAKPQPPTTRPAEPFAMNTRTVEVIRGVTVSTVTITLPTLRDSEITSDRDKLNPIH